MSACAGPVFGGPSATPRRDDAALADYSECVVSVRLPTTRVGRSQSSMPAGVHRRLHLRGDDVCTNHSRQSGRTSPSSAAAAPYRRGIGVREQSPTSTGLVGPLPLCGRRGRPPAGNRSPGEARGSMGGNRQPKFFASVTSNICDSV